MKKIIAAAAALTASFGMIGSSGAFAESYNYDLDDIEGLYYANDDSAMLGDANGDGIVDGRDASDVLSEYAAVSSGKAVSFTDEQKTSADVNSDDSVDGRDASAILAYYAQISAGVKITVQKYMAGIKADSVISEMSLHDKVCQMFIVRPEELTNNADISVASQATVDALKADPVCGLIYFKPNLESPEQAKEMLGNTKNYAIDAGAVPLFYGVDEEGGAVSRCADSLGTSRLFPMYMYRNDKNTTMTAYQNAQKLAADISQFGFNLDFAPVADTWSNPENTVIGNRAYSDDFETTAMLVGAAVRGFDVGGVYCTLKYFPGHGNTSEDSHNGMAVSDRTAEELKANEYLAFDRGIRAGADMVMVGHITVPSIDTLPASLSPKMVNGQLREVLGYDGVVITDSMDMGAVSNLYSSSEAAVMAVEAGCDIILTPANFSDAVAGLENAVKDGTITEERINQSVKRILILKDKRMDIDN